MAYDIKTGTASAPMGRVEQLAVAYEAIARVNHYMVGVVDKQVTVDELDAAEQLLISRQNALRPNQRAAYKRLDLALDLLAYWRERVRVVE